MLDWRDLSNETTPTQTSQFFWISPKNEFTFWVKFIKIESGFPAPRMYILLALTLSSVPNFLLLVYYFLHQCAKDYCFIFRRIRAKTMVSVRMKSADSDAGVQMDSTAIYVKAGSNKYWRHLVHRIIYLPHIMPLEKLTNEKFFRRNVVATLALRRTNYAYR